ncbi:MAG: hypothetical protein ACKO86_09800, partial [Dolichospermum sp.]
MNHKTLVVRASCPLNMYLITPGNAVSTWETLIAHLGKQDKDSKVTKRVRYTWCRQDTHTTRVLLLISVLH